MRYLDGRIAASSISLLKCPFETDSNWIFFFQTPASIDRLTIPLFSALSQPPPNNFIFAVYKK